MQQKRRYKTVYALISEVSARDKVRLVDLADKQEAGFAQAKQLVADGYHTTPQAALEYVRYVWEKSGKEVPREARAEGEPAAVPPEAPSGEGAPADAHIYVAEDASPPAGPPGYDSGGLEVFRTVYNEKTGEWEKQ